MSRPYFKPDLTDPLLTTREAAHRLGVSMRTVQLWVEAGTLAAGRTPGGHRRIRASAVTALAKRSGIASPESEINAHVMNAELVGALRGLVVELQDSGSREMARARELLAHADAASRSAS